MKWRLILFVCRTDLKTSLRKFLITGETRQLRVIPDSIPALLNIDAVRTVHGDNQKCMGEFEFPEVRMRV